MIELKGVSKHFDKEVALHQVDLKVQTGTTFGLLGSNGAGKSTILRLLAGIYGADTGEVKIDGDEVYEDPSVKQRVFFINDETIQWNGYTVTELKEYYKRFYRTFSEEVFERLSATIKIPLDKKMSRFSKGMKRQAIMMIGLACNTDYLLLDEAFDGLDPTMRIIVKRMLVDAMIDRKLTTIVSSHNLEEMNELCDAVALIHEGKLVFYRELDDAKRMICKVQIAFDETVTQDTFKEFQVIHFEQVGSVISLIIKGNTEEIKAKLQKRNPKILDIIPLTLEEIFIYEMEGLGYDYNGLE